MAPSRCYEDSKNKTYSVKKVLELKTGTQDQFYLNNNNILKRKVVINNLEVTAIVIQTPLIHTLLHKYHNCKGHQGSAKTFNMLKCKHEKSMRLDVRNHISSCITCSKNLPNTACHPSTAFRNTQSSFCMYSHRYHW